MKEIKGLFRFLQFRCLLNNRNCDILTKKADFLYPTSYVATSYFAY